MLYISFVLRNLWAVWKLKIVFNDFFCSHRVLLPRRFIRFNTHFVQISDQLVSVYSWTRRRKICKDRMTSPMFVDPIQWKISNFLLFQCSSHFCANFTWLFIAIGHIAVNGTLIGLDWTEGRWLTKVMIAFLCWECLMFCFMIVIKALFRHYVSRGVSRTDVVISQESAVKKQTTY